MPIRATSFVLFAACPAVAQSQWIVDAEMRPGSHFATLAAAVANAAPGDLLFLRRPTQPQAYTGTVIDKPLAILGEFDSTAGGPHIRGTLAVRNIPAGGRVLLGSLVLLDSFDASGVAGRLTLANLRTALYHFLAYTATFSFTDCANVEVADSELTTARDGFVATRSRLRIVNSVLESPGDLYSSPGLLAGTGLELVQSDAIIVRSTIHGGGGYHTYCLWNCNTSGGPHYPAVDLDAGSSLVIGPDSLLQASISSTRYSCCVWPLYSWSWGPAIEGSGRVEMDPSSRVDGTVSVPLIPRESPSTWAGRAFLFGDVTAGVAARPGAFAWVAASFRPASPTPTPLGDVGLDLASAIVVGTGPLDAQGRSEHTLPVTPFLPIGSELAFQTVLLGSSGIELLPPAHAAVLLPDR